jgi:hypothetical protein
MERFHTYLLLVLGLALCGAGAAIIGFAANSAAIVGIAAGAIVAAGLISVFFALAAPRMHTDEAEKAADPG